MRGKCAVGKECSGENARKARGRGKCVRKARGGENAREVRGGENARKARGIRPGYCHRSAGVLPSLRREGRGYFPVCDRRRELPTTESEERLMAAAEIIGERDRPSGRKTPAAAGMQRTL